jgi:3-mercaptopyruvate sulfurtransferase SseA
VQSKRIILDLLVLVGVSTLLGLGHLGIREELAWVADPPDPQVETCSIEEQAALVQRMSIEEALELVGQPGVTFVDARETTAFEAGHVPGALSLPAAEAAGILEVQTVPIPPDDLVITYCDTKACERSEFLGVLLRDRAGCQQVRVLAGGWSSWVEASAPIESEAQVSGG